MHNHSACCEHANVKYCKVCQIPYCVDCHKEWGRTYWNYGTTVFGSTTTYPYGTTAGAGDSQVTFTACTHEA